MTYGNCRVTILDQNGRPEVADVKEGDLYIRFREAERTEGEPTDDGLVIAHYDQQNRLAAVEIINLSDL